jgi:hypothetical protein
VIAHREAEEVQLFHKALESAFKKIIYDTVERGQLAAHSRRNS